MSVEPYTINSNIDNTKGYIYGKFKLDTNNSGDRANNWLAIKSLKSNTVLLIPFDSDNDTYALALTPGTYMVEELIHTPIGPLFLALEKFDVDHLPLPTELSFLKSPFQVEANNAYYIGDYVSLSETKMTGDFFVIRANYYYGLKSFEHKFLQTTEELIKNHPEFIRLQKVDVFNQSN